MCSLITGSRLENCDFIMSLKSQLPKMAVALVFMLASSLPAVCVLAQVVNQQLVGTWTSKSGKVITGPNFYNPIAETINEPALTGISYSFTADGYFEEALFRAIPNPVKPSCPGAVIQWQHGSFVLAANSSLHLTPIAVDGRQLLSEPCKLSKSLFTRYSQKEMFIKAEVGVDSYNERLRLDLYTWDGVPLIPMWLAYSTPEMLPTTTLNPTVSATASGAGATSAAARKKAKREVRVDSDKWHERVIDALSSQTLPARDHCFWIGVGLLGLGSVMFFSV